MSPYHHRYFRLMDTALSVTCALWNKIILHKKPHQNLKRTVYLICASLLDNKHADFNSKCQVLDKDIAIAMN